MLFLSLLLLGCTNDFNDFKEDYISGGFIETMGVNALKIANTNKVDIFVGNAKIISDL